LRRRDSRKPVTGPCTAPILACAKWAIVKFGEHKYEETNRDKHRRCSCLRFRHFRSCFAGAGQKGVRPPSLRNLPDIEKLEDAGVLQRSAHNIEVDGGELVEEIEVD
jgi:hypothetical protein